MPCVRYKPIACVVLESKVAILLVLEKISTAPSNITCTLNRLVSEKKNERGEALGIRQNPSLRKNRVVLGHANSSLPEVQVLFHLESVIFSKRLRVAKLACRTYESRRGTLRSRNCRACSRVPALARVKLHERIVLKVSSSFRSSGLLGTERGRTSLEFFQARPTSVVALFRDCSLICSAPVRSRD